MQTDTNTQHTHTCTRTHTQTCTHTYTQTSQPAAATTEKGWTDVEEFKMQKGTGTPPHIHAHTHPVPHLSVPPPPFTYTHMHSHNQFYTLTHTWIYIYYTQNLKIHLSCLYAFRYGVYGWSCIHMYVHVHAQKQTQIHTRTCIVAHIPLQAGPAHKGHHVALYSLWHEAPTLPALHCPLPAGEHAPKPWPLSSSVFISLFHCLSPCLPYMNWDGCGLLAFGLQSAPKLKMNGCVFVMEHCWEILFPRLIVCLCVPPNFQPSSIWSSKYCVKHWRRWLIAWISVK